MGRVAQFVKVEEGNENLLKFVEKYYPSRVSTEVGGYWLHSEEEVELQSSDLAKGREHVKDLLESQGWRVFTEGKFSKHQEVHRTYELSDSVTVLVHYTTNEEVDSSELDRLLDEEVLKAGLDPEVLKGKEATD